MYKISEITGRMLMK